MDENGLDDELFKKNMARPYEYLTHSSFQVSLKLTKEDFWSKLKQTTLPYEKINFKKIRF